MGRAGPPEYHRSWQDILTAVGEDVRVIETAGGRLLYCVASTDAGGQQVAVLNSTPYIAYGGPDAPTRDGARALLEALREAAAQAGADVFSVGTPPYLTEAQEQDWRDVLQPTHVFENTVHLQSLATHPLEQLTRKRRVAIESELRRAERAGLVLTDHLDSAQLEEWLDIYRGRYAEIGAMPYPDAFHRELHARGVPAGVAEFRGLLDPVSNRLLGGIVLLVSATHATYFSSAFVSAARGIHPTTFVLNAVFDDLLRRGVGTFNWHSSPSSGGVRAYKQRWGARAHRHFYMATLRNPATALFNLPTDEIRRRFPFRFVLPFSAWPPATME